MLAPELKADIQKLWDRFWSGGIANPLTAVEQIVYLIFMKRIEEMDNDTATLTGTTKGRSRSIFSGKDDLRRWSKFRWLEGDELLHIVREQVFPLIKDLGGDRMRDAVFVIPSPTMLQGAIEIIDKLFITSRNADTLGDIYEFLLSEIQSAGKNGQFRTPRHIIRAIVQLVNPQFDGKSLPRICDPACGTAGFLVNSYIHIMAQHTSPDILHIEADGTPQGYTGDLLGGKGIQALRSNTFYGYDFDRTMVRVGWMNLIQHGLTNPHIEYADALSRQADDILQPETFDYVLANPPFTGSIEASDKSDRFQIKSNKTELLFLELILDLLKVGGRAGVIVPEGVLFGSTNAHRALRRRLLEENQLEAVVSLPAGVFQPYSGVKTSVLIFTKGSTTESVWFYDVRQDGYSLDARRQPQLDHNDLWDLVKKYPGRDVSADYYFPVFREELRVNGERYTVKWLDRVTQAMGETINESSPEPLSWTVKTTEIAANDWSLSAGLYQPITAAPVHFDLPAEIIKELQNHEDQIIAKLQALLSLVERGE